MKKNKKLSISKFFWKFFNKKKLKRKAKIQLKLRINTINYKRFLLNFFIFWILIILFVLKTNFFRIQNLNIISTDENSNAMLIEKKLQYLKHKHIFNINKQNIQKQILSIEENLKKIKINIIYPNTINIEITSYNILFKTHINKKSILISENWVLIPTKNIKNKYQELNLKHYNLPNFFLYKKIFNNENLKTIHYIQQKLNENIVNIQIKNIIFYQKEMEVHYIINNDSRIIFDLSKDIDFKLKQLFVFNKEKINIIKQPFIYLDNRIIWKIYYCTVKDSKQCIYNLNYIYNENINNYKKIWLK